MLNRKKLGVIMASLMVVSLFAVFMSTQTGTVSALMKKPDGTGGGGGGGGGTPAYVTITNPTDGETVSGTIVISVDTDQRKVTFAIDGTEVGNGLSFTWDTTAYTDGTHTIEANARKAGDVITVTVDNGGSPPPPPPPTEGNLPWWNDVIDAEVAHANGITGDGSVVVIIDTGLAANYVDLFPTGSILTDYCYSQTKALGKDSQDWDQDDEGHGTACTGTVIGYDLNGEYVTGVAPNAKIVMIRTLYWVGGFGPSAVSETEMLNAWADAIYYALDLHNGALSGYNMIISMSLGYTGTNSYLGAAVSAAEADGVVLATSAGNDGHATTTTGYPASYADTTSVAAAGWDSLTGAYGIEGIYFDIPEGDFSELIIADFSSGGKVDVTGIGYNLVLPQPDGFYYMSGTSFSCPQVAGVYALMFEAHGAQSVAWMESTIQSTAYWANGMTSFVWGDGFVQADAACGF